MAKCSRCGSVRAVGQVLTMSPDYVAAIYDKEGFKQQGTGTGRAYRFSVCMSCILKIESFIKGKDFHQQGQGQL